jgi:beta-glucosidase-like glycosyl hydrolase
MPEGSRGLQAARPGRGDLPHGGLTVATALKPASPDRQSAARKTIEAGVDLVLVANNIAHDVDVAPRTIELVAGWVREGSLDPARIDASYQRILGLKRWARVIG